MAISLFSHNESAYHAAVSMLRETGKAAIQRGVHRVIIMDGRVPHAILMELLTNEGAGTMVYGEEKDDE